MSCNISGLKKEKCYGCYASYNICPLNAIDMLEDEEGFEYPKENEEKSINFIYICCSNYFDISILY